MNVAYSTSSDGLMSPEGDEKVQGVIVDFTSTPRGVVRLREFYSAETATGLEYEVEYEGLERCDDECRYEMCSHYDRDVSYRFEDEAVARGKFAYLVEADQA